MSQPNPTRTVVASLLGLCILLQSFSFLSIKYSTMSADSRSLLLLLLAFGFLATRAVIWQLLLKKADITQVYPAMALVQVLVFGYAVILFGERVEPNNVVGLVIMLTGVTILSRSSN